MKTILILLMLNSPCFAKAIVVDRHVLSEADHDPEVLVSPPNKPLVIKYNVSKQMQDQKQLQPNVRTQWCDEKGCDDWKDEQ